MLHRLYMIISTQLILAQIQSILQNKRRKSLIHLLIQFPKSELINSYNANGITLSAHKRLFDSSKVESHSAITITNKLPKSLIDF